MRAIWIVPVIASILILGILGVQDVFAQVELITNGDFETGTFVGWTITDFGFGTWNINDGTFSPPGPGGTNPPISGSFDAVTAQSGAGTHILSDQFTVPSNIVAAQISWKDRIFNFAGIFSDPNQEARVQLLNSTGNTTSISQIFSTNPGDPLIQVGPNTRSFDITTLLQSLEGQSIRLNIEQADNLLFFNYYVDDVSILVSTSSGGGGSGGGGSASKHLNRPTFGLDHNTGEQLVEKGFTANFNSVDITDNFHTDFEKQIILVGQKNTFSAKSYAPYGLELVEFMFGIPEVGNAHQSEAAIEVWLDRNGEVQNITVTQKDNLINTESVTASSEMKQCTGDDTNKRCYSVTTSASFNEAPLYDVFALKGVDFTRRTHLTYFNEGFDITGDPLNPPQTDYMPSGKDGLVQMIRFDKFENLWVVPNEISSEKFDNLWVDPNGIVYTRNELGSWFRLSPYTIENNDPTWNVMTRYHDEFSKLIDNERKRATLIFDGSLLLKELPDYIPNAELQNR